MPFLHGYDPRHWRGLTGFVIEDAGGYWTGDLSTEDRGWSRNPRRALVELWSPWLGAGGLPIRRGRCVEVLLEDEATMLPLRHWPRQGKAAAVDADDRRGGAGQAVAGDRLPAAVRMRAPLDRDPEH